jgi:hypothetical protein
MVKLGAVDETVKDGVPLMLTFTTPEVEGGKNAFPP